MRTFFCRFSRTTVIGVASLLFLAAAVLISPRLSIATTPAAPAGTVILTPEEREWLQQHPVIRLAPDPDFRPIEFFDKNGVYQGAAADIVRLLERTLGIRFTIVRLKNWDEVMDKYKKHEVDVLGALVDTPARRSFTLFTDPLVSVPGGIFTRVGASGKLTMEDLKGKKVAVVSNYTAHDVLKNQYPGIDLDVVPDVMTGLAKASLGMVDAYVENMANATYYSQATGITNLRLAGTTPFMYQWGIGIRKDWPMLQQIVNKGLAAIGETERQEAVNKWIHVENNHWLPSRTFVYGFLALLLGMLLAGAAIWNRLLTRKVNERTTTLQLELKERQRIEEELKILTDQLEARVSERTAELEKTATELQDAHDYLGSIIDAIADPVFVMDAQHRLVLVNDAECSLAGCPRDMLLGKTDYDLFPKEQVDVFRKIDDQVLQTGRPNINEERITDGQGRTRSIITHKSRFVDQAGNRYIVGVIRDVTERLKEEEDRRKLEEQMLHVQKLESLGVLAGGIAHDFNNILTAITGNVSLALMRINTESPAVAHLQKIEQAADKAADLAKQMLAYSGKGKFILESIDLNRLIEEMGHMLDVSISKKAVLRYNLTRPLPSIEADATQLRQIIMNLVINASEAIGDRSGVIAITTGCMDCEASYLKNVWLSENLKPGLYVYLEVADTGCGMSHETMSRIFEPFFSTKFTGRGLGMAAVLGIVRGHKGAINVYSELGKGSSFKVLLPAVDRPADLFNHDEHAGEWKGCGRIMLVDDEETVRAIGREMLQELGFDVITASDGKEAMKLFNEHPDICAVILDLTMPHMDGEQTFRALRKANPDISVIISSGYSEQEVTQRFVGKGLAGFIQKPYKLSTLKEVLRQFME